MNITLVQMTVQQGLQQNVTHLQHLLEQPLDTDMIVLPEMWTSPYQNDMFATHSVTKGDSTFVAMQHIAKQQHAYLVAGSVPQKEDDKCYNTTFVFDPTGTLIATYKKIHLFEITYPNGTVYKEADTISRGNDIITFDTPFGSIGLMICFDIRFPILAKKLQEQGAAILVVPAAFNQYTGPVHWELAFRSRAVDNQLFTIGVSPSTASDGIYQYYGHSIAVNPFGEIICHLGDREEIKTITINPKDVQKIRKAFPILSNEIVL